MKPINKAAQIMKGFVNNGTDERIEKSVGGEGSHGGKVIGHTKSGKPIYATNGFNIKHKEFTSEDHKEAAALNRKIAAEHYERARKSRGVGSNQQLDKHDLHQQIAKEHDKEAEKKKPKDEKLEKAVVGEALQ